MPRPRPPPWWSSIITRPPRSSSRFSARTARKNNPLAAGDLLPIPTTGPVGLRFLGWKIAALPAPAQLRLLFLERRPRDRPEADVPRGRGEKSRAAAKPLPNRPGPAPPAAASAVYTIPVKILADDHEPRVQEVWEKRIRHRLAEASDIFEHHCRVRFQVVAVGSWTSDAKNFIFEKALADLSRRCVPPRRGWPSALPAAINGCPAKGTPAAPAAPLHPYILVREAFPGASEAERLEFLVHEMGHYLGAVHRTTPPPSCVPFWATGMPGR